MKKIALILVGVDPVITFIAPSIWHYLGSDEVTERLIYLSQTPNENMEDWGGYNVLNTDSGSPFATNTAVSIKQYTVFAAEFNETPRKGCPANYRTLQECVDALENNKVIYGIMLNDNI